VHSNFQRSCFRAHSLTPQSTVYERSHRNLTVSTSSRPYYIATLPTSLSLAMPGAKFQFADGSAEETLPSSETNPYRYRERMAGQIPIPNAASNSALKGSSRLVSPYMKNERQNLEASHMTTGTTACAPTHVHDSRHLLPPSSHMPRLPLQLARLQPQVQRRQDAPSLQQRSLYQHNAPHQYHQPNLAITRDMVCHRIWTLLRDNLPEWWSQKPIAIQCVTGKFFHIRPVSCMA